MPTVARAITMNRVKAARPEMAAIGAKVLVILKVPFEWDDEG